ncbi:MAG TPA: MBOAT family O-acyltransferase [Candidatus Acidoferrum sp.]|nr:MBOAT family O-acyltransferase [Candidatus Acidoferrum sp.]
MTFNSVPYLVLLPLVVAAYWLLPQGIRRLFVLIVSVLFYASWGLVFVWVPLLVAGLVYFIGQQITADPAGAKRWMWLGVSAVLALLVFFKYRGFLLTNLDLMGYAVSRNSNSSFKTVAFPVGISFYTFEAISYLIDLRQGRVKMPMFVDLCLFFFFWPNVLSGPIVRARELMPQLNIHKAFEPRFVFEGMDRIIWGLVQKNAVANILGIWVDRGFATGVTKIPTTIDGWFLAIGFALQIYFDFAGYTNMAIGVARLLGVTLPENFRQPYHARTPAEFWTRWHMTLSRWIRDYLFFPINAKWLSKPLVLYSSMVGVMALVGLWHGAGWGFILWGVLHGIYLVGYRLYESWNEGQNRPEESRVAATMWRVATLTAVVVAWVPFRAASLQKAGAILASMFLRFGRGREYGNGFYAMTMAVALFCALEPMIMAELSGIEERAGACGVSAFRVIGRPIAYLFGILLFLFFDENNAQFIYTQF